MAPLNIYEIFQAFLILTVAIDVPGTVPLYMSMVSDMSPLQQRQVLRQAVVWAAVIGTSFFLGGTLILTYLGITVADFQIAGGLLLVALSLHDLLVGGHATKSTGTLVGVVPLATPLIAGPAVMTVGISLIQVQQIGTANAIIGYIANLALLWLAGLLGLRMGRRVTGVLLAASKVILILLSAVGVNMVLKGLAALGIIVPPPAGPG